MAFFIADQFFMQKSVKRGDAYRITVRFNGQRYTATRDTSAECEQWAAKKLLELQSQPQSIENEKIHISFYALYEQYYNEHGKYLRSSKLILQYLMSLKSSWGVKVRSLESSTDPNEQSVPHNGVILVLFYCIRAFLLA